MFLVRQTDCVQLTKENLTESALFQSFVGTVLYLSPEMIRREGHGTPLDFYCLGCLLYVLLTGKLPHFTGDVNQMCARRAKGEAFEAPANCSPTTTQLCERLLEEHKWFEEVDFRKVYRKEPQRVFPNFPPIDPRLTPDHNFSSQESEREGEREGGGRESEREGEGDCRTGREGGYQFGYTSGVFI
ncbi:Protein kinase 2 [Symbiodinium microadriaticum]|uniref:Protein kinase 2 n=1 Tax=Symbiodinium microadriaticum TaxID=2951 RepID=A0A1Q9EXU2_SYMMI|nr:Protein kinase 2 [Symbiodinium microadriaticum]